MALSAVVLPLGAGRTQSFESRYDHWLTALILVVVSVLNVELGRALMGGLQREQQPHKALSAWAFAAALLLPSPWLLAVVPFTYAHARWRGLRVPLWKWVGSACFVALAATAAAVVAHAVLGSQTNLMQGTGGRGFVATLLAAATFLLVEATLFAGMVVLNRAEDEVWLRRTLSSASFYTTEGAVLMIAALLSAVWTGGPWFVALFVPIYALAQRAVLHEPLKQRAATAAVLAEQNAELESLNRFKADLMGMLGHEIGNPLTSVVGYAEVGLDALDDGDDALARRSLAAVDRNAAQVQQVLHELLALVALDTDALTAVPVACELEARLLAAAAAATGLDGSPPEVECPPGLKVLVQPSHFDQILSNLLSNAQKYAGGAVRLSAHLAGVDTIEVAVVDAGPGIPDCFRERLFERFSRDEATAPGIKGTGLGLFISRELARANGGDIVVRDVEPTGSAFVVTLPHSSS